MRRDGGYEVVAGERRYRAIKKLGLEKVPVVIRNEDSPRQLAEVRLVENIQRENLNPIELAEAYRALQEEHGFSNEDLAVRLGKDRSSISNTTRLLQLPRVRFAMTSPMGAWQWATPKLFWVCRMNRPKARWLNAPLKRVGPCARPSASVASSAAAPAGPRSTPSSHIRELEANLFRLLGSPVKVKESGGGKGTIAVSFNSKAQFQRVVEVFDRVCKEAVMTLNTLSR